MKIVALLCLMKSNVCVNFLKVQPFRSFKGLKRLSKSTSRRMHDVERERERERERESNDASENQNENFNS